MYIPIYLLICFVSFANSLENIYLDVGNKQGVNSCPDQIIPDNNHGEPHDAKIDSYNVNSVCTENSRCCYIKHCPDGNCVRFCLYRPADKYYTDSDCPPFNDGEDLWYVPGSNDNVSLTNTPTDTPTTQPNSDNNPSSSSNSPQKDCCADNCVVCSNTNCRRNLVL